MYSLQVPDEPLSDKRLFPFLYRYFQVHPFADFNSPTIAVITYVNRQSTSRRALSPESHASLVAALNELQEEGLAEVYDTRMEAIGKKQQFALSSRTNVRSRFPPLDSVFVFG